MARLREENAILVAHELAANALEHAATRAHEVTVEVEVDAEGILITVRCDRAAAATPVVANAPSATEERGRGLAIVGALADWWESPTDNEQVITARLAR